MFIATEDNGIVKEEAMMKKWSLLAGLLFFGSSMQFANAEFVNGRVKTGH